jgi:glycosyltransferase involved in cell wall biosynthesis
MISRILGAKGVREFARAAMLVKKTHPQARFRLVGFYDKGPDAIAESEVAEWVAGGLEYLGPSDNVLPHLAACRIYVLPSYREGTPRSVLEAMATGRAILTSNAPGCRETVRDGVNGYLVPVRDVEALAQRMRQLIDDPELTARMGAASLRIAREKFDVHEVNAKLMRDLDLL